jgi:hypothetical protein
MKHFSTWIGLILACGTCALNGQTTASGTINATLVNKSSIALIFDTNTGGVALSGSGSPTGTLNFGTVSAYGTLPGGVTRLIGANSFTIGTFFNIQVIESGVNSSSYTLTGRLTAAAPTGCTYLVDGVTLSTTSQTLQTASSYDTDIQHAISLVVSTAAPGAGGPTIGSTLSATLNFTATAN